MDRQIGWCGLAWACLALMTSVTLGQLQITEVLYNSVDEPKWEWTEVRNMGAAPIDLNGYYFDDDDGTALSAPNIVNVTSGGNTMNTIIPAGGVAVLYNGASLSYDDARFRAPWNLGSSVPLIGVATWPGFANGGDAFGLWSASDYAMDIGDPEMTGMDSVQQFTNAATWLDYSMGFPSGADTSITWNGAGNYQEGSQWQTSVAGVDGATTSVMTITNAIQINNTNDFGNPGLIPPGPASAGLLISEIMYNPASSEPAWEWVEVYNNTGATIDFGSTPYILDDDDLGPLLEENITSGSIADGGIAILYNADSLSLQNVQDAWGAGLNYIPVTDWPGISNTSDAVGIWDDFATYQTDEMNGTFTGAVASVLYADSPPWPQDDGSGSIYQIALDSDPNDGANWFLSQLGDGFSFNAQPAIDAEVDNPGGDVGSPGFFAANPPVVDGDFNDDGVYNCEDVDPLVAQIVSGANDPSFDLTGDGLVNTNDLAAWLVEGGNAEVGGPFLEGDANLDGSVDVSDFNVWNSNKFEATAAWCLGDFNADGFSDVSDFNLWNSKKFQTSGGVVPEPAAGWLVLLGVPGLLRRRGGRRSSSKLRN